MYFHFHLIIVVTFGFSANNFFGEEGANISIDLIIVKEHKVRLANPVTIRITPLTVGDALENGMILDFDVEDHLSPTRATGMTIVLRVNPSTLPNSIKKPMYLSSQLF